MGNRNAIIFAITTMVAGSSALGAPVDPTVANRNFNAIMSPQQALQAPSTVPTPAPWTQPAAASDASVEVTLGDFEALWDRSRQAAAARTTAWQGPALVLGAARYRGRAIDDALELEVSLDVTLAREGVWKTVPLVGEHVVLVEAVVDGLPVAISKAHGFHVWTTQRTGEAKIQLKIMTPAHGPKGSIEFDFVVPRTPVTHFDCTFPLPDLEPRIDGAVKADVQSEGGATTLLATLRPTTRIHLVGFRDLGDARDANARVYAESLNLLSVDDGAIELFSEVRYTILYAGTKRFDVAIPAGMTVASADGKGAFRYELEETATGTVLHGETAFPMRGEYEMSLRLRRETKKGGERFAVPIPRHLGAERDVGWLAVEVPGKLRLEPASEDGAFTAVDTRQLPPELVRSAVSPILRAFRYRDSAEILELEATRLPEADVATETIDRLRAFTVVSAAGKTLTEARYSLRNRLRHGLAVTLPRGATVASVLLDGTPAKPSQDAEGRLLLPLKRSEGGAASLTSVTLQVVYEQELGAWGLTGTRGLALPTAELPIASAAWTVYLPDDQVYGELEGPWAPQSYAGSGTWTSPMAAEQDQSESAGAASADDPSMMLDAGAADTGAMPVRISLPTGGIRVEHARYWLDADEQVSVDFRYAARSLRPPVLALCVLLLLLAGFVVARPPAGRRGVIVRLAMAALGGLGALGLLVVSGMGLLIPATLLGAGVYLVRRGTPKRAWARLVGWAQAVRTRWVDRPRTAPGPIQWRRVWQAALVVAMGFVAFQLASTGIEILGLVLGKL